MINLCSNKFTQRGFTLIELLAVIVITGLGLAIVVPSGINTYSFIQLDDAQKKLLSAMRTARSNAISDQRNWEVFVEMGPDGIPVIVVQNEGGSCDRPIPCQRIPLSNYVRPGNVTFNGGRALFTERGQARLGQICLDGTYSQGETRCVVVSTILGAMRKSNG